VTGCSDYSVADVNKGRTVTKYNDLIDAQVRLLQAHVSLVEEMQRTAKTKNRLAMIFRSALQEPLEVAGYAPVCANTCRISRKAMVRLNGERPQSRPDYVDAGLRYEHPIPLTSVLYPMLKDALSDPIKARQMIIKYLRPAWVTVEEDESLRLARLTRRMPDGWQEGGDVFARYKAEAVRIELL
jgi:hypothetical protein